MTDETEALRKRVEELEKEINDLLFSIHKISLEGAQRIYERHQLKQPPAAPVSERRYNGLHVVASNLPE